MFSEGVVPQTLGVCNTRTGDGEEAADEAGDDEQDGAAQATQAGGGAGDGAAPVVPATRNSVSISAGTVSMTYTCQGGFSRSRTFIASDHNLTGDCGPAAVAGGLRDRWHDVVLNTRATGAEAARQAMVKQHDIDDAPPRTSAFLRQLAAAAVGTRQAATYLSQLSMVNVLHAGEGSDLRGALVEEARHCEDGSGEQVRLIQEVIMMTASTAQQPMMQMNEFLIQLIQDTTGVQILIVEVDVDAEVSAARGEVSVGAPILKGYSTENNDDLLGVVVLMATFGVGVGSGHYKLLQDAETGEAMLEVDDFAALWCREGSRIFGPRVLQTLVDATARITAGEETGDSEQDAVSRRGRYREHILKRIEGASLAKVTQLQDELLVSGCLQSTRCIYNLSEGCLVDEDTLCVVCAGASPHPACAWCMKELATQTWRPGALETGRCQKDHASGCTHQTSSSVFEWVDATTPGTKSLLRWDVAEMVRHCETQKREENLKLRSQHEKV